MKSIILLTLCTFFIYTGKSGCNYPSFHTSNGIVGTVAPPWIPVVHNDSLRVSGFRKFNLQTSFPSMPCPAGSPKLYYNGVLVAGVTDIPELPGQYSMTCVWQPYSGPSPITLIWRFSLIFNQRMADSMLFLTSLSDRLIGNNSLELFPNPAKESFTVRNNIEPIQSILIIDFSGETLLNVFVDHNEILLDARGLSSGVYLLQAATRSKKTVIKKLVIQ